MNTRNGLRLTGTRDRLIGCIEKESILGKDISTCLPVSLNFLIPVDRWFGSLTSLIFKQPVYWPRHPRGDAWDEEPVAGMFGIGKELDSLQDI